MFLDYCKLSWLGIWGVCFVFIIIYQHNLIIQRNYEKQRLSKVRLKLENERNELYRLLLSAHNPETITVHAESVCGMRPLQPSQVLTCTATQGVVDFIGTSSSAAVLQVLGLLDVAVTKTGRNHASA